MKLLTLLSACKPIGVGVASLATIGGGAIAVMNSIPTTIPAPEAVVEEAEVVVVEDTVETPEGDKEDTPAQGSTEATETPAPQPTVPTPTHQASQPGSQSSEPAQETAMYSIVGHKRLYPREGWFGLFDEDGIQYNRNGSFTNIYDFEEGVKGMCPQDIPADAWPGKARPGVALGIVHSAYGSKDPLAHADEIWSSMKAGENGISEGGTWLFAKDLGLGFTTKPENCNLHLSFTLFWSTRTIDWIDWYNKTKNVSPEIAAEMDAIAAQMTARIRQREAEFRNKCGY